MPISRESNNAVSSNVDVACTHCRHRKIRCGRERPQCSNCARDDVECDYQIPGKRINHMKLLCNNVEGLDDRLLGIEDMLCRIVATLKKDQGSQLTDTGLGRSSSSASLSSSPSSSSSGDETDSEESTSNHYRGPLSLRDLCQDLKDEISTSLNHESLHLEQDERSSSVQHLMQQMCLTAATEHEAPHQQSKDAPQLPSRQHIQKAQGQFFRQTDSITDIFVHENFIANMDRIYTTPYRPADEPWIICFKAIVLLVLGLELADASTNSIFGGLAGSFLLPGGAPMVNSSLLTAPRLINVQALILLSVLAQQQESQAWSDMLFAQACTLAKTMRLHRADSITPDMPAEERRERFKVFQSLFIRDKELAISRGTVSWLTEASRIPEGDEAEQSTHANRLELAKIQNKVYRLAHSSKPRRRSSSRLQTSLARIEDELSSFARSQGLFGVATHGSSDHVSDQIAFLSTRIGAMFDSPSEQHAKIALLDSRASCLALLLAFTPNDSDLRGRFEKLVSTNRAAYQFSTVEGSTTRTKPNTRSLSSMALLGILHSFPAAAIFTLVKNIISPQHLRDSSETEDDLALVQRVYACYVSNASIMAAGSCGRMLMSTYQVVLQLLSLVKSASTPEPIPSAPSPAAKVNMDALPQIPPGSDYSRSSHSSHNKPSHDITGFPGWPTPNSMQENTSWDGWQDAMNGMNPDMNTMLLSNPPDASSDSFSNYQFPTPPQTDITWNMPQFQDNNALRKKRRRTDDGYGTPILDGKDATGLAQIDDFLTSPDALQMLLSYNAT